MELLAWVTIFCGVLKRRAETLPATMKNKFLHLAECIDTCVHYRLWWRSLSREERRAHEADGGGMRGCGRRECLGCRRAKNHRWYKAMVEKLPRVRERAMDAARIQLAEVCASISAAKQSLMKLDANAQHSPFARSHYERARRKLDNLRQTRRELKEAGEFEWYLVTVGLQYDVSSAASVSVQSLRARILTCRKMVDAMFAQLFSPHLQSVVAWAWVVECNDHGLVHAHIAYRGPARSEEEIASLAAPHHLAGVDVDVERIKNNSRNRRRVLRYLSKPDTIRAKKWKALLRGETRRVVSPELEAHFRVAARRLSLRGCRGVFYARAS